MFQTSAQFNGILPMLYSKKEFIQQINHILLQNLRNESFSIAQLAQEVNLSRSQLHRRMKGITQLSATDYVRQFRLRLAAKLIRNQHKSISQIAYAVGFNNLSYFSRAFKKEFGLTPQAFFKTHNN
ncbi:MAG: helix-turn-helix domain-containing protein [Chitinophagales bacterium]